MLPISQLNAGTARIWSSYTLSPAEGGIQQDTRLLSCSWLKEPIWSVLKFKDLGRVIRTTKHVEKISGVLLL